MAAFVEADATRVRPGTVRRRLASIMRIHRLARAENPCADEEVRLAMRRIYRRYGRRRRQALGLDAGLVETCLASCDRDSLAGKRDAALIMTLYDTLCRRSELAALAVEDLAPTPEGGYLALVRRSKTDVESEGRWAVITPRTAEAIRDWLTAAEITEGPLFRNLRNGEPSRTGISRSSVGWLVKRIARRAGLDPTTVAALTSHSGRVGRAQELALAGHDHLAIMRAGGWKTIDVVARYVEAAELRRLGQSSVGKRL